MGYFHHFAIFQTSKCSFNYEHFHLNINTSRLVIEESILLLTLFLISPIYLGQFWQWWI